MQFDPVKLAEETKAKGQQADQLETAFKIQATKSKATMKELEGLQKHRGPRTVEEFETMGLVR